MTGGARRLSQAISEGDGISIIALVADADTARAAEEQGAEGLAVEAPRRRRARCDRAADPVPRRRVARGRAARPAPTRCLIVVEEHDDEEHLEELHAARHASSGWRSSSTSTTTSRSRTRSSGSTRRSSCSRRATPTTTRTHVDRILDLLPDVPAGKLAIADLPTDHARRGARARAGRDRRRPRRLGRRRPPRRWRAASSLGRWGKPRARLPPPRALRRRSVVRIRVRRPLPFLAAILGARGGAAADRDPVRPAVRQPAQPGRAEHRPAGVEDRPRRRARPALVRLPVAAPLRARAVPGVAGRARRT